MKRIKPVIIGLIGITCFSILIVAGLMLSNQNSTTPNFSDVNNITLIIDYGDGTQKVKERFSLPAGQTTAFDALDKWCEIEYNDFGTMGYLVTSIDGKSGDWIYFVNDESPNLSSTKLYLSDGDVVKWVRD